MRDFNQEFPHLGNILGFFNQDYRMFGATTEAVLDKCRKMTSADQRRRAVADLNRFLQTVTDNGEAGTALTQFHVAMVIRPQQPLDWLNDVRRILSYSLVS